MKKLTLSTLAMTLAASNTMAAPPTSVDIFEMQFQPVKVQSNEVEVLPGYYKRWKSFNHYGFGFFNLQEVQYYHEEEVQPGYYKHWDVKEIKLDLSKFIGLEVPSVPEKVDFVESQVPNMVLYTDGVYRQNGFKTNRQKIIRAQAVVGTPGAPQTKLTVEFAGALKDLSGIKLAISYTNPSFADVTASGETVLNISADALIIGCDGQDYRAFHKPTLGDSVESLVQSLVDYKASTFTKCRLRVANQKPYFNVKHTGGDQGDGLILAPLIDMDYLVNASGSKLILLQPADAKNGTSIPMTLTRIAGANVDPTAYPKAKALAIEVVGILREYGTMFKRLTKTANAQAPADPNLKPVDPVASEVKDEILVHFLEDKRAFIDAAYDSFNAYIPVMTFEQKMLLGRYIVQGYAYVHALEDTVLHKQLMPNKIEKAFLPDDFE